MACNKQEGPTAFCDLFNAFKKYEEDNYQKAKKTELEDAKEALNRQADSVCDQREEEISYKHHMQAALCEGRSRVSID